MQVAINDLETGQCLCRKAYPEEFISSKGMEEEAGDIIYTAGTISYSESWFEGMRILSSDYELKGTSYLEIENDTAFYTMIFCLEGSIKLRAENITVALQANYSIFIYVPQGITHCELAEYGKSICIQLTEKCYHRLVSDKKRYSISEAGSGLKILPAMHMILKSLGERAQSVLMRRIFLETGALQLLVLQLEKPSIAHSSHSTFLKDHDIQRIHHAKTLIEEDIRNPGSLIELAHKVGLNDFKLKKGFKELFGTTVFGYLHALRMDKARKMLLEEKRSVGDVSDEVGYKNPHHFSAAFKKKFGILPGQLNK